MKSLKYLVTLTALFTFSSAFSCGNLPKKIDNEDLYAEVKSLSQFELEFSVLLKERTNKNVKIIHSSGVDFPSCDQGERALVHWDAANFGTHWIADQGYFSSSYMICLYNNLGEVSKIYKVCNWEVGD